MVKLNGSTSPIEISSSSIAESSSDVEEVDDGIQDAAITGASQKGPFVNGSKVTLYELDGSRSLSQTGRTFSGNITSDDGKFSVNNISLKSRYAKLEANGFYRNEVTGENSKTAIILNAYTDLAVRSKVNVNLLTHLEYYRVNYLMSGGNMKLSAAKKQAQREIFRTVFGEDASNYGYSEDLDVFGSGEGDAALLALSIMLQGDRTEADLTALLTAFGQDIEKDSVWNGTIKGKTKTWRDSIADWAFEKDLVGKFDDYRTNVKNWGLSENVPDFEKFIRKFYGMDLGLGVCNDGVKLGTVKQVSNARSKYYASSYTSTEDAGKDVRFICDKSTKLWRVATEFEKDTYQWTCSNGKITDEKKKQHEVGELLPGRMNTDKYYTCDADIRVADAYEILLGQACVSYINGKDQVPKNQKSHFICKDNEWIFNTELNFTKDGLEDTRDGQTYNTVLIGNQTWMAENLNYAYNTPTSSLDSSSFCFNNSADSCAKYGRLYLWSAAMDSAAVFSTAGKGCGYGTTSTSASSATLVRGVCPVGWHLPDTTEWKTMFATVGGISTADKKLKFTDGWNDSGNGEDSFGFSVLPAGYYSNGGFVRVGRYAQLWSSAEEDSYNVYGVSFNYRSEDVSVGICHKNYGFSVRCLLD